MKRILLLCLLALSGASSAFAQLLEENFNFTGQLTANGWAQVLSTATNPISTASPGLSYPVYGSSGIGNTASLTGDGQDVQRGGWTGASTGSLYLAAMINLTSVNATGDYFLGFYQNGAARGRIYAKSSGAGFVLGVSKAQTSPNYSATVLNFNTTHLIVMKYTFQISSTTDDQVSLFVNPVVNGSENGIVVTNFTDGGTDMAVSSQTVILRQTANTPVVRIDGVRVSNNWAEILSAPPVNYYYKGTGDLKQLANWGINADGSGTPPTDFTSPSQSFVIANTTIATVSGTWTVSGANSKIVVPAGDTLNATAGASIGTSVLDVALTGAFVTDNLTFPTWGTVAGSVLLQKAGEISVPGAAIISIPNFGAGGDFILTSGDLNMGNNDLTVDGKLQINGSNKVYGTGIFILNASGTLRIGHPLGITAASGNLTGAVQFQTARSFSDAAAYTYIGSGTSLVTGDGLPAALISASTVTIRLADSLSTISLSQATGSIGASTNPTISMMMGRLKLGNNDLTVGSLVNGSPASYILTDGTGSIKRPVPNTGGASNNAKNFFVGTPTQYRRMTVTFPSASGLAGNLILTVRYNETDPGSNGYPESSDIAGHSSSGYWELGMSPLPVNAYRVEIETAGMNGAQVISDARILKRNSASPGAWEFNAGTSSVAGSVITESNTLPSYTRMDIVLGTTNKFFHNGTGAIGSLSSWGRDTSGIGANPASFSGDKQLFYFNKTSTISGTISISGARSRIVIDSTGYGNMNVTLGTGGAINGNIQINPGATLSLAENLNVAVADSIWIGGTLSCPDPYFVGGNGKFVLPAGGNLRIGSADGITASANSGSVRTAMRSFNNTTARYIYTGTGTNLVTGDGLPETVGSLFVSLGSPSSILTLSRSTSIGTGSIGLDLYTGKLRLAGTTDLRLGGSPFGGNSGASAYIVTAGTGSVIRAVTTATASRTFHIGSESRYRKALVTYTSVSTTDSLRVRYVAQDPGSNGLPATITNYATEGYWVIGMTELANVSGATYSLELETVDLPGVQDISGLRILKRNAPADPWLLAGTQAAAVGTSIRETAVTGFSEFAIGTTSVNSLPVSFGSFTAQVRNLTQVALEWNTLTERDNQYFEIERSADGRVFTGIGRVTGRGSSLSNSAYNFVDVQPGTGKVFYRIRQVDKTGRYAYSKTLMVQLDAMLGLTLSPNPVRSDVLVNIGLYKAQSGIRLSVMDMNGKTHYAARVQSGAAFRLDMQGYAPGIYTIRLSDEASGMQLAEKKLMKL